MSLKLKVDGLFALVSISGLDKTPQVYPKLFTSEEEAKETAKVLGSNPDIQKVFINDER